MVDQPDKTQRERMPQEAYVAMSSKQPLTITVERAADILGVGRSTAYELVRSGHLKCIRLRRRIVIPISHLAERLGVERENVWAVLDGFGEAEASRSGPSQHPDR